MGNQQTGAPGGPPPGVGDHSGQQGIPPGVYGGYGMPSTAAPNYEQPQRRLRREGSDASMAPLDPENAVSNVHSSPGGKPGNSAILENWLDDDTVPTVFRWEHGGRQVYITGTFNGWSRQIPMHRSGNDFTYIHNLKRGKHAFKFIVDDEWRFAPDQPTVADIEGRINNFIDVTDFKAYTGDREFEKEKAAAEYGYIGDQPDKVDSEQSDGSDAMTNRPDKDGEVFSNKMPDLDDYTKEPPPASAAFTTHYFEQTSAASRYGCSACSTACGIESSLLYSHQGQYDGPGDNTKIQDQVCNDCILLTLCE